MIYSEVMQTEPCRPSTDRPDFDLDLMYVLDEIHDLLLRKNKQYGNSALNPLRIFSTSDAIEQIKVRIDDKLSRLASGQITETEDTELDLLGYLILLRIARRRRIKQLDQVPPL